MRVIVRRGFTFNLEGYESYVCQAEVEATPEDITLAGGLPTFQALWDYADEKVSEMLKSEMRMAKEITKNRKSVIHEFDLSEDPPDDGGTVDDNRQTPSGAQPPRRVRRTHT